MSVPARFLHIGFKWSGVTKEKELEAIFNSALDWARYAPNCWVLWTTTEVEEWFKYIKPYLGPSDWVLIAEIDLSSSGTKYTGWADEWFWKWVQKSR